MTGNQTYRAVAEDLVLRHRYDRNMLNQRITAVDDVNFSDDQLAFLALYLLVRYGANTSIWPEALGATLVQSMRVAASERSALFNAIAFAFFAPNTPAPPPSWLATDARWTLQVSMCRFLSLPLS